MPVRIGLQYIDIWKSSMEDAVRAYEAEEAKQGQIVFYGASNFTRWSAHWQHKPLAEVLVGVSGKPCCINRGFGSSCAEHQLYYYPRMIRPLKPSVLVYSPLFGNGKAFGYSTEENWELAQRVLMYALTDLPETQIYIEGAGVGQKTTEADMPERIEYNSWLQEFAASHERCTFVDKLAYEPLRRRDIFVEDGIHYNQQGYDLYADFYREVLKEELAKF